MPPVDRAASRRLACAVLFIALTGALTISLVAVRGLHFPPSDGLEPAMFTVGLCAGALIYRRRAPQFSLAFGALAVITTFTAFYSVLMYAIASLPTPLADPLLQSWDAACGAHLPDIVAWSHAHPLASRAFRIAYDSVMLQTAGLVILLSFTQDARHLRGFTTQFMTAALITAALFVFFPAEGPCARFGYPLEGGLDRYVSHLHELRSGVRTGVTWRNAEGLISFPSFHTTWAILLAWAVRRRRGLNVAAGALNVAVIISTLTTGMHYFIDVPAGAVVAVITIAMERRIERWIQSPRQSLPQPPARAAPLAAPGIPESDLRELGATRPELLEV